MPADCDLDRGSVVRPDECIGRGRGEGCFPGRHTGKPGRFGRGRAPSGRRGGRVREERHDRRRRATDHQEPQDDLARGLRSARSRSQTSHGARHDLQHPLDDQTADGRRRADAGRRGETAPGRPRGEIPTRIRQRQIEGHHDRATPATSERIASDDHDGKNRSVLRPASPGESHRGKRATIQAGRKVLVLRRWQRRRGGRCRTDQRHDDRPLRRGADPAAAGDGRFVLSLEGRRPAQEARCESLLRQPGEVDAVSGSRAEHPFIRSRGARRRSTPPLPIMPASSRCGWTAAWPVANDCSQTRRSPAS